MNKNGKNLISGYYSIYLNKSEITLDKYSFHPKLQQQTFSPKPLVWHVPTMLASLYFTRHRIWHNRSYVHGGLQSNPTAPSLPSFHALGRLLSNPTTPCLISFSALAALNMHLNFFTTGHAKGFKMLSMKESISSYLRYASISFKTF